MLIKSIFLKKEADIVSALIEVFGASLCLHRIRVAIVLVCTSVDDKFGKRHKL